MRKIRKLGQLLDGTIVRAIGVANLCPNIPHDEGLASVKEFLGNGVEKQVTTDTMRELAELGLKSDNFEFNEKTCKQICRKAIDTKFAPSFAILFTGPQEPRWAWVPPTLLAIVKRN